MPLAFDVVYSLPTRFLDTSRLSPETLVTVPQPCFDHLLSYSKRSCMACAMYVLDHVTVTLQ